MSQQFTSLLYVAGRNRGMCHSICLLFIMYSSYAFSVLLICIIAV